MLQAIRDRAQGIFAWVMLILIGVPFALWGINNYFDSGKEQPAAVVGGHEIFDRDVSRAYEQNLASLMGIADYDEKQLRQESLERLIQEEVIAQGSEKKSLTVGEDDIRGFIQTLPYFQTDGKFDKDRYKSMLATQHMSPGQFAAQVRRALMMEQYQKGILDSAFVTKDQVDTLIRLKNQEREIEYATIPLKPSSRNFTDAEIEAYYREHAADFRNPEQASIEYVSLSLADLAKDMKVTDEELHRFYEEQKASLGTEERRKISHILIPVTGEGEAASQAALAKATATRARLDKGEDFAKVAQETSGDTTTAKQGGDLGFMDKNAMEEAFAQAVAALKAGEVSQPVKTSIGYHLIKLTELIPAKTKSFDEAKEELRKSAQQNAAENKFYEQGQTLAEQAYEHPDSLEAAAKLLGLEIKQAGPFTRESGEGVANEEAVRKAAFAEEVINGRNSDPVEIGTEQAIVLRVKDHQPASDKPLSEVKDTILAKLRDQDARQAARQQAEALLKQAREGRPLAEAAKTAGLSATKPAPFRRGEEKLPPTLVSAAFKAERPAGAKPVFANAELDKGEIAVFGLLAVKDGAASANDAKETDSARQFLSRSLGQREFGAFAARLRELADVQVKPES
jgi:peptidyl-prolyl cis-trans isomerase D